MSDSCLAACRLPLSSTDHSPNHVIARCSNDRPVLQLLLFGRDDVLHAMGALEEAEDMLVYPPGRPLPRQMALCRIATPQLCRIIVCLVPHHLMMS